MEQTIDSSTIQEFSNLINIIRQLRDPENGCPWDIQQNHHSLIKHLIEETYEVVYAIENEDNMNLCEELGDLMLQIILHSQIACEEKRFELKDVLIEINKKLIKRHPHVFSERNVYSIDEAEQIWNKIKESESIDKQSDCPLSDKLRKKIRSQPPLMGAMTISQKTASLGFEWESISDVLNKVDEELLELKEAINSNMISHAKEELGDLLFTLVNISRWLQINIEDSLQDTNEKFLDRFCRIEKTLGGNIKDKSISELEKLWQKAKKEINRENNQY